MRIEMVVINGQLRGRRFQDRFNLAQLGYVNGMDYSRNGGGNMGIKKARRMYGDFTFSIVKGDILPITIEEKGMLSPALSIVLAA